MLPLDQIITGDCRQILPTIPAQSFKLAFADPPYWVGFDYGEQTDREMDYIDPTWLVSELLRIARVALVTPGIGNEYDYPKPDWKIAWNKPASTGRNDLGGFNTWEPVFVYGKPDKPIYQDSFTAIGGREFDANFHKCPKPLSLLKWLIEQFTEAGDSVIDPVSGSGTTCKAAYELGRHYLGIEIMDKIADKSRQRLAQAKPPLFTLPSAGQQLGLTMGV